MTHAHLQQLLDALPDAARLINADGETIVQNTLAQTYQPSSEQVVNERELDDDWRLETWKPTRASDPDLRALANGLAHTLRNPLSSIMTAADLVKDDPGVSEESAMLLGIVAKESRQLNRILTDFLNFVRPRSNPPTRFDLAKALRQSVQDLKRQNLIPDGIQVLDELPPTLLVWGDEVAITHSLCHVVQNAIEAMHGEGILHLSGEAIDGHKQVHVADSGPGFSDEGLKRAFEPFYSDRPENAGLGLSMALASVERAGGRLTIENLRDKATHNKPTRNKNLRDGSSDDIEYSTSQNLSQEKPAVLTQGARVCIELRSPKDEDEAPIPETNEIVTV